MLEIDHELVQKIARMKTPHSWAREIMLLPVEEADKAEAKVLNWIAKVVKAEAPEGTDEETEYSAERMVRDTWLHLLESEAIAAFLEENPRYNRAIPLMPDPYTAVAYAAANQMWPGKDAENLAEEVLRKIQDGELKPNLQETLDKIQKEHEAEYLQEQEEWEHPMEEDNDDVPASAMDMIPVDEKGEPLFEQAQSAEVAWDALVEYLGEEDAATWASQMVKSLEAEVKKKENALKDPKSVERAMTVNQFKAMMEQARQELAETRESLARWKEIDDFAKHPLKLPGNDGKLFTTIPIITELGVNGIRLIAATAEFGYSLVLKGVRKFGPWVKQMHDNLDGLFR